ncbi:hypothetical protein H5410_055787 [Solanum commersonii]|uniref:Uncharacterized protein n=1 Tax=Solanum commersonii TaxID=4109 RepID=A0A9J5WJQ9_SOLCO|nr:hypothetical protein H5410_055787 [Solanum commersonii]
MLIHFRKCHLKLHKYSLSNLQRWRNITNSSLLKNYKKKSEHKIKIDVHKVFDERLTSNCPTDTPIERVGEESISIESIAVELFNGHPQGELSERYVNATHFDYDSNEPQIKKIKILEGEIPADEVMPDVEYGKSYEEEEHDESALLVGRFTIVVDEFKEIRKTSTCQIANTFIDQHLLTQFQINLARQKHIQNKQQTIHKPKLVSYEKENCKMRRKALLPLFRKRLKRTRLETD